MMDGFGAVAVVGVTDVVAELYDVASRLVRPWYASRSFGPHVRAAAPCEHSQAPCTSQPHDGHWLTSSFR